MCIDEVFLAEFLPRGFCGGAARGKNIRAVIGQYCDLGHWEKVRPHDSSASFSTAFSLAKFNPRFRH